MAQGINKVMAIGNVGGDPETKFLPSGTAVCNFSVALNESWVDKQTGEKKERTEWLNVEAWGKLAEICGEYLTKGRQVYVEGKLQTDKWEGEDGQTKYRTKVRANIVQMLGKSEGGPAPSRPAAQSGAAAPQQEAEFDEEIPF